MKAIASASGGVIFIPETVTRKSADISNDNTGKADKK